jgi:hypothetical protein
MGVYATQPTVNVRTTIDRRYNKENISYGFNVKSSSIFHPFAAEAPSNCFWIEQKNSEDMKR